MPSRNIETLLLILPIALALFAGHALYASYSSTGEFLHKDIDLSGGVQLTVHYSKKLDVPAMEDALKKELSTKDIRIRTSTDPTTGVQKTISIEAGVSDEKPLEAAVGKYLGMTLSNDNRSISQFNPAMAASFWAQVQRAFVWAFALMSLLIFFYFRNVRASVSLIFPTMLNMFVSIGLMSFFGVSLSLATFAAIMMLLGYGIDSNIVLANNVLKKHEGTVDERIANARRTGFTMVGTTFAALGAMYFFSTSPVLQSISLVLMLGLVADLVNTWVLNVYLLKRFCL